MIKAVKHERKVVTNGWKVVKNGYIIYRTSLYADGWVEGEHSATASSVARTYLKGISTLTATLIDDGNKMKSISISQALLLNKTCVLLSKRGLKFTMKNIPKHKPNVLQFSSLIITLSPFRILISVSGISELLWFF